VKRMYLASVLERTLTKAIASVLKSKIARNEPHFLAPPSGRVAPGGLKPDKRSEMRDAYRVYLGNLFLTLDDEPKSQAIYCIY
jgi:hypothetical protein